MATQAAGKKDLGARVTFLSAHQCAIVLVHYNNPQDTLACLRSLRVLQNQPAYIVVTDNGSRPDAVQTLHEGWKALCDEMSLALPAVISTKEQSFLGRTFLLTLQDNTGFSGGNNAALRILLAHTNCAAFWLLNNDTEPAPDALDVMCTRLNMLPSAGICGSTLVYTHRVGCVQCTGGGSLVPWLGTTQLLNDNLPVEQLALCHEGDVERRMAFVSGASMLVRRVVLEQVGLLPEEYFLYYEEVAYAQAVRRAGFSLAWAKGSMVSHKEGGSTGAVGGGGGRLTGRPAVMDYLTVRNRFYFIREWYPWALPTALCGLVGVFYNRWRRGQTKRLGLVMQAAWNGILGRVGKPSQQDMEL